jgi:hypothetical protein
VRALLKMPDDALLLCCCPQLTDTLSSDWGLNVSCIVPAASTASPNRAYAVVDAIHSLPEGAVVVIPLIAGAYLAPRAIELAAALAERRVVPIIDASYIGTAVGLEDDTLLCRLIDIALPLSVIVLPLGWVLPSDPLEVVHILCASADSKEIAYEKLRRHARTRVVPRLPVKIFATIFNEECLVQLFEKQALLFGKRMAERRVAMCSRLDFLGCPPGNWKSIGESQAGPWFCTPLTADECTRVTNETSIELPVSGFISLPALDTELDIITESLRDALLRIRAEKDERKQLR